MLSHVHIGVRDLDRAVNFYGAVLEPLGWRPAFVDRERGWSGWRPADADRPLILVGLPYDGEPATCGNGQMVGFAAESRAAVDRFHDAALAAGGRCEGPPGLRPEYHAAYYGAYVRDPDGNKLCVCCHAPEG
jgi:catechol 2,3-dioxygenase-like lactoylglutathione lyase family enzyme